MATSSASLDRSPRKNWVENAGGLHPYHRKIARAIHQKRGVPLQRAIAMAIGRLKRWAAGGDNVNADTRAKAAAAVAHWERIKAKAGKLTEAEALGHEPTPDENLGIPTPLLLAWVDELDAGDDEPAPTALVEAAIARRAIKRLADGTFAPKGQGMVLNVGDRVTVPHRSGRGVVPGTVRGKSSSRAIVRLEDGPDKGTTIMVEKGEGHAEKRAAETRAAQATSADATAKPGALAARFRSKVQTLKDGQSVHLPDGIGVARRGDDYLVLEAGKQPEGGNSPKSAAERAIGRSMHSTAPSSLGGAKRYSSTADLPGEEDVAPKMNLPREPFSGTKSGQDLTEQERAQDRAFVKRRLRAAGLGDQANLRLPNGTKVGKDTRGAYTVNGKPIGSTSATPEDLQQAAEVAAAAERVLVKREARRERSSASPPAIVRGGKTYMPGDPDYDRLSKIVGPPEAGSPAAANERERAKAYQALDPLKVGDTAKWGTLTVKRLADDDQGRATFEVEGRRLTGSRAITRMVEKGRATARPARSNAPETDQERRNREGGEAVRELDAAQSAATRINLNPRSTPAEKRAAKERVDRALAANKASRRPAPEKTGEAAFDADALKAADVVRLRGLLRQAEDKLGTAALNRGSGPASSRPAADASDPMRDLWTKRRNAVRAELRRRGVLVEAASPPKRVDLRLKSGRTVNVTADEARRLHLEGKAESDQRPGAKDPPKDGDFESKHPRGGKGTPQGGKFVKKGSTGTEVRAIQRRVGARVDGEFGDRTAAAVKAFQKAHGLTVDGVVGRQTVAAMRGRRDAKRVATGELSKRDREFLSGHIRGQGGRRGQATMVGHGRRGSARLVEAVAPSGFLERVHRLEAGELARLPDGGAVKHYMSPDGRPIWVSGRPSDYNDEGVSWGELRRSPEEAVADALTRSAGSTDPASIGGTTRFSTHRAVMVNGRRATFVGVGPNAEPLVRFDGDMTATASSWPELVPAPRLVEGAEPPKAEAGTPA